MRLHTSPLQALYRVFVQPALLPRTRPLQHVQLEAPRRQFHLSAPSLAKPSAKAAKRTQLWDDEIPAKRIVLVDPVSGSLLEPQPLRLLLRDYDHKTHRLVCVSPLPSDNYQGEWIPTCKMVDKKEEYQKEKARKKTTQAKAAADDTKTLELNWAIDGNDLGHRMKKMQEFLGQGKKVEIVLARKKKGRKATVEECEGVLQKVSEAAMEIRGTKEIKEFEGKLMGMGTLMYEGPKPTKVQAQPEPREVSSGVE